MRFPVEIQMIAGEEKSVVEEQNAVALRVAGGRNCHKAGTQLGWFIAVKNDFRTGLRGKLIPMDNASAAEILGKALCVGYVVPVGQKDVGDAAKLLETFDQRPDELRGVD